MKQGQGDATECKQVGLGHFFHINLTIYRNCRQAEWSYYHHFDLNAGCGFNHEAGCIGSPLAFLKAAEDTGCDRIAPWFVDHDPDAILQLEACLESHGDPRIWTGRPRLDWPPVVCADNAAFIGTIPDLIRKCGERRPDRVIGSVFCDPNGTKLPVEQLAWLSEECPGLDFVIHYNATALKRARGVHGTEGRPLLEEVLPLLNKRYWLVRRPATAHQFTLLVGRNIEVGDHGKYGLYRLYTDKGRRIFHRLNLTEQQFRQLPVMGQGVLDL